MTPADIAAARAVCSAAVSGPWTCQPDGLMVEVYSAELHPDGLNVGVANDLRFHDAAFIAAARTGWPAALDAVEQLAAQRDVAVEARRVGLAALEEYRLAGKTWVDSLAAVTAERDALFAEVARTHPVVEAAKAWRTSASLRSFSDTGHAGDLARAVDALLLAKALVCTCVVLRAEYPAEYDSRTCPTHGPDAPRYFVDHGMIHDRVTSKHILVEDTVALLNAKETAGG